MHPCRSVAVRPSFCRRPSSAGAAGGGAIGILSYSAFSRALRSTPNPPFPSNTFKYLASPEKRMTEQLTVYPLDVTYRIINEAAVIHLFCKAPDGRRICVTDPAFRPYFYVQSQGSSVQLVDFLKKLRVPSGNLTAEVTAVEHAERELAGKPVQLLKVFTKLPSHVPIIRAALQNNPNVKDCFEYDILFARRYLIDKGIVPLQSLTVSGAFLPRQDVKVPVFEAQALEPVEEGSVSDLRLLAIDIETYTVDRRIRPQQDPVLMVALYGMDAGTPFRKVITWKRFPTAHDFIEFVDGELALLQRFKEVIEHFRPDIITGYYSDGFDFPYLDARARKYRIRLDLGLDYSELNVNTRAAEARIAGIVHLDVLKFIRQVLGRSLETDSHTLDAVAHELLGERKHAVDLDQLAHVWDSQPEKLGPYAEYNLHDARLTYRLCERILPNIEELAKLVGAPLSDVSRMSFSRLVEGYLMFQALRYNQLIPNRPGSREAAARRAQTYEGAFVYQPTPGLYLSVVVFDFRSLYPTIITSHNISPGTVCCSCCHDLIPGEKLWFCRKRKGFLPAVLETIITRRMRIKEMIRASPGKNALLEARADALKLLANSFYGYLGFAPARWYHLESARSITALGRFHIQEVIAQAQRDGFSVIYSDTDSIFLTLGEKSTDDALRFVERINATLPGLMELEYQGFYPAGVFVSAKARASGAKKKYALLAPSGTITIKGFETVRRNWSPVAKQAQEEVLSIILKERDTAKAVDYVRGAIAKLRSHAVPSGQVLIATQLRKPTDAYDSVGPHVAAARRMQERGIDAAPGTIIRFLVVGGKGLVRDRVRLPEEAAGSPYDAEYYINNQIIPAVDRIFAVLGVDIIEAVNPHRQSKLGAFFG